MLRDIRKELNDDDLGRGLHKRLKSVFSNANNTSFKEQEINTRSWS